MIASVASGLGGRFFDELRDKLSLCYTVTAFSSARRAAGTFGAYIATSPEKEDAASDGFLFKLCMPDNKFALVSGLMARFIVPRVGLG